LKDGEIDTLKVYVARCEAAFKEQKEIKEQHKATIQGLEEKVQSLELEFKDLSDTNNDLLGTIQKHDRSDQEQNDRVLAQNKLIEHQKQAIKGLGTDHQLEAQQREKEICVLQDQLDDLRKQLDNCQFISSPQLDNCQFISSPQDINSTPENLTLMVITCPIA
jgi:chromosome segregation ATPase